MERTSKSALVNSYSILATCTRQSYHKCYVDDQRHVLEGMDWIRKFTTKKKLNILFQHLLSCVLITLIILIGTNGLPALLDCLELLECFDLVAASFGRKWTTREWRSKSNKKSILEFSRSNSARKLEQASIYTETLEQKYRSKRFNVQMYKLLLKFTKKNKAKKIRWYRVFWGDFQTQVEVFFLCTVSGLFYPHLYIAAK